MEPTYTKPPLLRKLKAMAFSVDDTGHIFVARQPTCPLPPMARYDLIAPARTDDRSITLFSRAGGSSMLGITPWVSGSGAGCSGIVTPGSSEASGIATPISKRAARPSCSKMSCSSTVSTSSPGGVGASGVSGKVDSPFCCCLSCFPLSSVANHTGFDRSAGKANLSGR